MSDIILSHVEKAFGDHTVLKDFSHVFPEGEITVIRGASGCGKTTLLRLISGIYTPDSGEITGVPQKLSFVFQEDRLAEDFSALSNIRLVTGKRVAREEIERHLDELSLREVMKKPVRDFSGGMKRRVAISRAVLFDADLLLLDEPFKGLDQELKKTVMDYVLKYTRGKTVICVTHDPAEEDYLGGNLLIMKGKGRSAT